MADELILTPFLLVPLRNDRGNAMILAEDDWVFDYSWHWDQGYARCHVTREGKETNIRMHRLIMANQGICLEDLQVDHINGDRLDNRRCNLRVANQAQQSRNKTKKQQNSTSRFKGVHWNKEKQRWVSAITKDGKRIHLGYFNLEEQARDAYASAATELFGEFAAPLVERQS